jgi:hypothetical protein
MIATERPTIAGSASKESAVMTPIPSGPSAIPAANRKTMLGTSKRSDRSWAATPIAIIAATSGIS